MKLADLIDLFREEAGDVADPPLYGDTMLTRYANEGQREACRRARLLTDSSTAAICQYAVAANATTITLDPRVLFIRRVRLASVSERRIPRCAARDLDAHRPDWESADPGDVLVYVPDWESGKLRFYPAPAASDTVNLTVIRLPLVDMAAIETDSPEIRPEFHERLVDWMIWRAYNRDDSETFDDKKAARAYARFEAEFGPVSTAKDDTYMRSEYDFGGLDGVY